MPFIVVCFVRLYQFIIPFLRHQDVQERLCEEISSAKSFSSSSVLDYETVQSLPLLDKVIQETLRLYPIAFLERLCTKDYPIPGGGGKVLPKGTVVQVSSILFE